MSRAFSPSQLDAAKIANIPDGVYDAVNNLLVKTSNTNGVFCIHIENLMADLEEQGYDSCGIYDNGYLDFELAYEAVGWKVSYQPESTGYWIFSRSQVDTDSTLC